MKRLLKTIILWALEEDHKSSEPIIVPTAYKQPQVLKLEVEYKVGDRIKASEYCKFNRGFRGVVQYVEPTGTLWVRRDGSSSDCFYHPNEVEYETDSHTLTKEQA